MMTLYTGTPGAGKTLSAVSELLTIVPGSPGSIRSFVARLAGASIDTQPTRPIFVHGVPDLLVPHTALVCQSESCSHCRSLPPDSGLPVERWMDVPDGAFIVFDEAQHCFRPTPAGSPVPAHIAAFETHRHRGIDGVLITQHPKLIHSNVRRLISRHIHITRTFAATFKYEWPEVADDPRQVSSAVKTVFKHPKAVYGLYKSATIHNKHKLRTPLSFAFLLLAVPVTVFLGWSAYSSVSEPDPVPAPILQQTTHTQHQPLPGLGDGVASAQTGQGSDDPELRLFHPLEGSEIYLIGLAVLGDIVKPSIVTVTDQAIEYFPARYLSDIGYRITVLGSCSVMITYHEYSELLSCRRPPDHLQESDSRNDASPI